MAKSDRKKGEAQSSPSSFAPTAPLGAMFLGVAAARNLQMHGEGRPLAALDKATAMRRAGNPRESEVYRETNKIVAGSRYAGVHYGRDGKPRFEMSDADAKIKDVRAIKVGQSARLADLLHHPALYAAVPSAANLRVEKGTNPNASTFDGKTIKLNPTWFSKPALGREQISPAAMTSLLHEIQHHVQDMEGFDAGASISDFAHIADPVERRRQYERVAGEEEARLTGKSFPLRGAERRLRRPGADLAAHEDDPSGFDTPIAKQTLFKDVSAGRERNFFDVQGIRDVVSNAFQQLFSRDMADNKPARFRKLDPRAIVSDPQTFQFKSGGDSHGVTDRLKGVKAWDNVAAGKAVVYERANGELVIADGHQRLGLAKRLASEGQKINMDAYVLRERDGWTPKDVYAYAALKNIKESSGNALDMAKVMRERPDLVNGSVPMSDAKVREAANLSKLSKDAFDMVVGGAIKPEYAAQVGARIGDATRHADMLAEMSKANIASAQHAGLYVDQALAAGSITERQNSLFGEETQTRSLIAERAAVLDKALSALKSDKRIFSLLEREASTIEGAGNRLSHEANAERAGEAGNQAALIERLAKNRGPVSDMLEAAARQMAEGKKPNVAARSFVKAVGDALKAGGMNALTGEAAPAKIEAHDPNQNSMFSIEPPTAGQHHVWDAKAREASAVVRASNAKGKKAVARKTRMAMDSEKPPRLTKAQTNPESRAKWDRILDQIPADPKEVKLRERLNGEKLNKRGPLRMAADGPRANKTVATEYREGSHHLTQMGDGKWSVYTKPNGAGDELAGDFKTLAAARKWSKANQSPSQFLETEREIRRQTLERNIAGKGAGDDLTAFNRHGEQVPVSVPKKANRGAPKATSAPKLSKREQSGVAAAMPIEDRLGKQMKRAEAMGIAPPNEVVAGGAKHLKGFLDSIQSDTRTNTTTPPKATSGKRGTQNAANLEAINANKKAKAKGKGARETMTDGKGRVSRSYGKTESGMGVMTRSTKVIKQLKRAEAMGVKVPDDMVGNHNMLKGFLDREEKIRKNGPSADRQIPAWMKGKSEAEINELMALREKAFPATKTRQLTPAEIAENKRRADASNEQARKMKESMAARKADKYVAEQESRLGKPQSSTLSTGALGASDADRERRFISRMRAGDSQKTDAELRADFAKQNAGKPSVAEKMKAKLTAETAPSKTEAKSPKVKRGGKVLGLLAPIAIGAAMLATAKEAKAEGRSTGDAIKEAAKVGTEGTGTMVGFMAAHAGAVALAGKAGISAAKAVPGVNALMMAGNAAYEAAKAPAGHRLEAAARGAWDMSLPGMIVNTAKQVGSLLPETHNIGGRGAARGPRPDAGFAKANQAFKSSQATGQQTSTISTGANPSPAKRGFANFKVQAAAKAAQGKTFQKFTRSDLS